MSECEDKYTPQTPELLQRTQGHLPNVISISNRIKGRVFVSLGRLTDHGFETYSATVVDFPVDLDLLELAALEYRASGLGANTHILINGNTVGLN